MVSLRMPMQTKKKGIPKTLKSVSRRESPDKQLLTGVKEQDTAKFSIAMHGTLDG